MENFDRRGFLKIGAILPWGFLSWGDVLRAQGKKDISVIHLFLQGGLSQIDSFDPKPDCDPKFRSPFKTIRTNVPELQVTEHLPLTAKQADKFVTIRSMTHKKAAHGEAITLLLTGHDALPTLQPPSMGSVVSKELRARNELPPYVWIPQSLGNSSRGGFLGATYNPFNAGETNVPKYSVRDLDLPMGVDWARMQGRSSLLSLVDSKIEHWDTGNTFASIDSYYQSALDLMRSPRAKKAFDIAQEPEKLRERYGRTTMGQGCLLARRLVEAGVRFVTVSKAGQAWDHHSNIFPLLANSFLPEFDAAYATLLADLADRGMLDSTIVLVTGEFGRTPEVKGLHASRDSFYRTARSKRQRRAGVIPLGLLPRQCPVCGNHTIIGHGRRLRQAHDDQHERMLVRRGICHPCGHRRTLFTGNHHRCLRSQRGLPYSADRGKQSVNRQALDDLKHREP